MKTHVLEAQQAIGHLTVMEIKEGSGIGNVTEAVTGKKNPNELAAHLQS